MIAKENLPECPISVAISMIKGKWKLIIIDRLLDNPCRFSALISAIEGIRQKVLTEQLRSLEGDGIIKRSVVHEAPPRVDYSLTELGYSLSPILSQMREWGEMLIAERTPICYIKQKEIQMVSKSELPACPVATTVSVIGSKWKLLIIRNLLVRPWRFNELKNNLEGISQKVLTDSLHSMEDDGIVKRTVYPDVPPRVEYSLTELGNTLRPILETMQNWGEYFKSTL